MATVSASAFIAIFLLSIFFLVVILFLRNRYRKQRSTLGVRSSSTMRIKRNASAKQIEAKHVYEEQHVVYESPPSYEEGPFYETSDIYEEVRIDPDICASPDEGTLDSLCENPAYNSLYIK